MRWGKGRRGRVWPLGLMAVVLWWTSSTSLAAGTVPDYEVKAYLIVQLARLIDWPAKTFGSVDSPFVICSMGQHPVNGVLTQIAKKQKIHGRNVVTYATSDPENLGDCHVLFVAGGEEKRLDKILGRTGARPVLTVGDTGGFGVRGVLVNFFNTGNKVSFEINVAAVNRSGLIVPAPVLRNDRVRILGKRP